MLGDAVGVQGVSKYAARVKCAMLAWVAAEDALAQALTAWMAARQGRPRPLVGPAGRPPLGRVQDVAAVQDARRGHERLGRVRIQLPELLPLGQQQDGIGPVQRRLR